MRRLIKRVLLSNVVSFSQSLFNSFKSRVLGSSGVVEADSCAVTTLSNLDARNLLQSATFVLAPSGYKSDVIYSQVPSNGNGDLTVTRATSATRVNSAGLIESVASGVPQLDYSLGGCPNFLFEPQRTNNLVNSVLSGGGSTPTNWSSLISSGTTKSSTPVSSILNNSVSAYRFITSSDGRQAWFQYISVVNGTSYCYSVYVESVTTAITVDNLFSISAATGTTTYYVDGSVISSPSSTNIVSNKRYYIIFSSTQTTSATFRLGAGVSSSSASNFILSMPQVELGVSASAAFATSYIPTTVGAIATRNATSFTRSNIYTNGLIGASGFTWLFEIKNNLSIKGDQNDNTKFYGMFIGNSSTAPTSAICIYNDNTTALLKLGTISGTTTTARYTTAAASIKVAITYDGTTLNAWVNGTKQISAISFSATLSAFEHLAAVNTDVLKYIAQMALWNTILPDSQCASLTS